MTLTPQNPAGLDVPQQIELGPPNIGTPLLCIICAEEKPWGIFDSKTGAAVCKECRDKARAAGPLSPPAAVGVREQAGRCVAFGTTTGARCVLENDHAGEHQLEPQAEPPQAASEPLPDIDGRKVRIVSFRNVFDEWVYRIDGFRPLPPGTCQIPTTLARDGKWRELDDIGAGTQFEFVTQQEAEQFASEQAEPPQGKNFNSHLWDSEDAPAPTVPSERELPTCVHCGAMESDHLKGPAKICPVYVCWQPAAAAGEVERLTAERDSRQAIVDGQAKLIDEQRQRAERAEGALRDCRNEASISAVCSRNEFFGALNNIRRMADEALAAKGGADDKVPG